MGLYRWSLVSILAHTSQGNDVEYHVGMDAGRRRTKNNK